MSAILVLYWAKTGEMKSYIRLGGLKEISRGDSLRLMAQAIERAQGRITDET